MFLRSAFELEIINQCLSHNFYLNPQLFTFVIICISDINEVRRDVLGLESKIKGFKIYLDKELSSLKLNEKELIKKVSDSLVCV